MITLGNKEFRTDETGISLIRERVTKNTCKTNLNPQLLFVQSYTGRTNKLFVGNWTADGFWISKFRMQMMQFRPDIITSFLIQEEASRKKVTMRSSIGFSSLFTGMIISMCFSLPFMAFGLTGYLIVIALWIALYAYLASMEYDRIMKAIKDHILQELNTNN